MNFHGLAVRVLALWGRVLASVSAGISTEYLNSPLPLGRGFPLCPLWGCHSPLSTCSLFSSEAAGGAGGGRMLFVSFGRGHTLLASKGSENERR